MTNEDLKRGAYELKKAANSAARQDAVTNLVKCMILIDPKCRFVGSIKYAKLVFKTDLSTHVIGNALRARGFFKTDVQQNGTTCWIWHKYPIAFGDGPAIKASFDLMQPVQVSANRTSARTGVRTE